MNRSLKLATTLCAALALATPSLNCDDPKSKNDKEMELIIEEIKTIIDGQRKEIARLKTDNKRLKQDLRKCNKDYLKAAGGFANHILKSSRKR